LIFTGADEGYEFSCFIFVYGFVFSAVTSQSNISSLRPQVFYELIKTDERSDAKKPNGGFDTSTSSVTTGSTTTN